MNRRPIPYVISFVLFASIALAQTAGAQTATDSNATLTGCANIMPLGDSITAGTYGGYRDDLFTGLQQDNCGVTFVGTQFDPNAEIADKHHEGHPFFTINDIATNVDGWIAADQPNIIILMIGTNDVAWFSAETADQIGARHDALLTQIETDKPDAWIFVASIPPETSVLIPPNNVDRATLVTQFNSVVKKNVAARESAGQHVRFVDVNAALTVGDISADGIHPNQGGYTKIGDAILQSMRTALGAPSATTSSAPAPATPAPQTPPPTPSTAPPAPAPVPPAAPATGTATTSMAPPPSSGGGALEVISLAALLGVLGAKRRKRKITHSRTD